MKFYYDNSHLCPECTGAGCKRCYDPSGLREFGTERFPISSLINNAQPPAILNRYAGSLSKANQARNKSNPR